MSTRTASSATATGALRGSERIQPAAMNWGRNQPPKRTAGSAPTSAFDPPSARTNTDSTMLGWATFIPSWVLMPFRTHQK
jgi:hypothetical protein